MTTINKEEQREKILNCNGYKIRDFDYSMFGDEDVDVFEKLVSFDNYQNNIYSTLSDSLKNNKQIVIQAAKCFSNIPFIPSHFFQEPEVIKSIIYNRYEKYIPVEHLTKKIINYMFVTCSRSSLSTEDIKKACDKHLTKESIIKVLLHLNSFYSESKKSGAHPCMNDVYIPQHFLEDRDIIKLLIIPQPNLVKNNTKITKEMIIELLDAGYVLQKLPSKFFNDLDFIKTCLRYEHNYCFLDDYNITEVFENNVQFNIECIAINPRISGTQRYPLLFESFKEMFCADISTLHRCSNVIDKDRENLFDYLTSEVILELYENKDKNLDKKYDFSDLYDCHHYYKVPIVDNKFIIEEMAKQDGVLFPSISKDLVNDNQFMFKLLCEYKAEVDMRENPVEELLPKIIHFGSLQKYIEMLELEHSLSSKFTPKYSEKKKKI